MRQEDGNKTRRGIEYGTSKMLAPAAAFRLQEVTYVGGGEFVNGEYGYLEIHALKNAPKGLQGQRIKSAGLAIGAGVGSPIEAMAATAGTIVFDRKHSGRTLKKLFSSTKIVTTKSVGALFKYSYIVGYSNASRTTQLWHAHLFGGGVITLGLQGNTYPINFTDK